MIEREDVITGVTYKIVPPTLEASIYITINDTVVDGTLRPVEIFINCRHLPSVGWVSALSRVLSASFRNEGPFPMYLIEELTESFDADGGYIIPKSKGVRANSIVGHIGYIIEKHCKSLGLT